MPKGLSLLSLLLILLSVLPSTAQAEPAGHATYPWLKQGAIVESLGARIKPPEGFNRVSAEAGSFGSWLRGLPLKPGRPEVMLHSGKPKANQTAQYAVIDLDTGKRDLQQCADAVIRLRAEYLYSSDKRDDISFRFTSWDLARYKDWSLGMRPAIKGNKVSWSKKSPPREDYAGFRGYLDTVFTYAGSHSLARELTSVADTRDMRIGDVFIQGGFPGHAVIVVDMAEERRTGKRVFMIAQSYMPAQDMHILLNPMDAGLSPWYALTPAGDLRTPEWTFRWSDLKRFGQP